MSSNRPESDTADSTVPSNEHWSSVSKHVVNSYLEANNALLAAMGLSPSSDRHTGTLTARHSPETAEAPITELAFGDESWLMERSVDDYDDLDVGEYVRFTKTIDDTDVSAFAHISGDTNQLHLVESFAEQTQFGGRIAHGTLVAGTISAALARFPGLTIYLSQDLEFRAPVEVGTAVTATCEIVEELGETRYRLHTSVETDEAVTVIDGEAIVVIKSPPEH
ncbi:MaoC family dehydratase [Natronorubrum aibiense]|uniref:Dehydratase n=1 Tax=Natronorubrum aibiense TaxID=348826 RepID=A0A5P9P4H1_9EURY|nr:MaoC family dehydratase [Natronorubrum aibiense]QFU83022.1 dehydratase [Natronorubrum aibiense]